MIIFSPWAFGTTESWSIWTMNIAGYALGALLPTGFWTGNICAGSTGSLRASPPVPWTCIERCRGNLNEVLSWEEERVVQGDWTVACEGKRYQLDRQHEALSLVRRKVIVRTLRNGRVQLLYQGKLLKWRALPEGAARKTSPVTVKTPGKVKTKPETRPAGNHPWRRDGVGAGKRYWNGIKAEGRRTRAACRLGSGPPVGLRSAPASLRPAPQPGQTEERTTNNKGDILS